MTSHTSNTTATTSNIIDSVVKEVSAIMSTRLSRAYADYELYKESHDAILAIPAVQRAIRDGSGTRFKQEPQEEKEQETFNQELPRIQSQLTHCFQVIESLQAELQTIRLENDALRLQLRDDPNIEKSIESPSENITLIIEDLAVKVNKENDNKNEQEEEEDKTDQEQDEPAANEEEYNEDNEDNEDEEEENEDNEDNEENEEEDEEEDEEEEDQDTVYDEENEKAEEGEDHPLQGEEEDDEQPEEEQQEENEEEEEEEEQEVEVVEVDIKGKMYFTTNETSGIIYECLADGDVGDEIGKFVNGKPVFNTKNK